MDCNIVKRIGNRIQSVEAPNGEKSKLWEDIYEHIKSLPKEDIEALKEQFTPWEGKFIRTVDDNRELALGLYKYTFTDKFKKDFKGELDQNKEPLLKEVLNDFNKPKSEVFHQKEDTTGKTIPSKASPETRARYIEWAKRAGFSIEPLESLTDEKGNKLGANGAIDLIGKIIQIVKGKEDIATGEEVSHGIVRMIKEVDPTLFKQMMSGIGKYKQFEDVVGQYRNDSNYQDENGKPNIPKLKEEAIGKVFNELVINRLEGSTEKPELLTKALTWWDKIKEIINNLLTKIGFDPTSDSIEKAAKQFTKGKLDIENPIKDLTDKKEGESDEDFKKRTYDEIQNIANNVPDKTAIVTHGTVLDLLKSEEDDNSHTDNGDIVEKTINGKQLFFIRHGESEANANKEPNTTEISLTDKGKEDAKKAAEYLKGKGIVNVINTDTERTRNTASIIRKELGLKDTFLQKSDEEIGKEKQENIFKKVNELPGVTKKDDGKGESHYEDTSTGKTVERVTGLVKTFLTKLFKNKHLDENIDKVLQEYKKQFGTANHEDIANMHERHIDENGELRRDNNDNLLPIPLDSNFVPRSGDIDYYTTLENYIYGYVDDKKVKHEGLLTNEIQFPKGTKFSWEKTIYDPNSKIDGVKGLAGTLDLMAIKPNGKVSIFDWKFIGSLIKNQGIRDYMKRAYDKQMFGYTAILTSPTYGVKAEDIEQARMIPVAVKYNEEKGHEGEILALNIGNADYKNEKTSYLLPYVTKSEQSPDKTLQSLVTSLTSILNKTLAKGSSEKDFLVRKNKVENLERAILHIQLAKDFTPFIEQIQSFIKDTQGNLSKLKEELKDFKFENTRDLNKVDEQLEPINELIKTLELYSKVEDFAPYIDNKTEEGKKQRQTLNDIGGNSTFLLKKSNDILMSYMKKWAESIGIKDIENPQVILDKLRKKFSTLSRSSSPSIQAFYRLNAFRLDRVEKEVTDMVDEIKSIHEKVQEFGGVKKLSNIIEQKDKSGKGTNKLIEEFSSSTQDELKKSIKDKKWDEVRKMLDPKKFADWAMPFRKEQLEQIEKSNWLPAYGKSAEERKEDAKDKVISETTWGSEYSMSNFGRLINFFKEDLRSKEYKEMLKPENKSAYDFYNFTLKWNSEAVRSGLFHQAHMKTFLPWIEKSLADKLEYGGKYSFWDQLRKSFTSPENFGEEEIDPITHKPISRIPKLFIRDISKEDAKGNSDYSGVSDDLIKNVALFAESIIDYKSKLAIENTIEAIQLIEKTKGMIITDSKGNHKGISSENDNLSSLIDAVKTHYYNESILSKLDVHGGKVVIDGEDRELSLVKSLDSLKAWFSYNVLGFNTVTSIFRTITTGVTGFYNAGKYYTNSEFGKSYGDFVHFRAFKDDVKLQTSLMRLFYPVEENREEEIKQLAGSKVAEADFQEWSMKMVKSAHNIVQYVNFLTHMRNAVVINGKLMNAREYLNRNSNKYNLSESERKQFESSLDSEVKKLTEEKGLLKLAKIGDNGKLSIEGLDLDDFSVSNMKELIRVQGRMLSGNISENDQSHIRSNALARQMFLFTNWLPQAVEQRFGGLSYHEGIKSYEYGRTRMLGKMLFTDATGYKGVLPRLQGLIDIYSANDRGVQALNKMYETKRAEYLKDTGLELHMTSDEFNDMVRQNLKIQGKELTSLLTFIGLSVGLAAALPKKDDSDWKDAQGYFAYMKRIINRGKDELELFFNPLKFAEFGSGAKLPVLGIFGELTTALSHLAKYGYGVIEEDDLSKKHILPQIIHTLPNGKAIYDIGSVVFPQWYEENAGTTLNPDPQGQVVR